jgi:hypothetical protein
MVAEQHASVCAFVRVDGAKCIRELRCGPGVNCIPHVRSRKDYGRDALLLLDADSGIAVAHVDPISFHSFSQFQIPDVTAIGNGNPS